jgi:hypothetical protein
VVVAAGGLDHRLRSGRHLEGARQLLRLFSLDPTSCYRRPSCSAPRRGAARPGSQWADRAGGRFSLPIPTDWRGPLWPAVLDLIWRGDPDQT